MKLLILFLLISFYSNINLNFDINKTESFMLGIHYDPTTRSNIEQDLIKIKETGFNWIRLHLAWKNVEKNKGEFDFKIYDHTINLAKNLNLKIIAIIGAGHTDLLPKWILKEGSIDNPNYLNYLTVYAKNTVQRYTGKIDSWQIENELNHVAFYKWVGWRTGKWNETQIKQALETLANVTKALDNAPIIINVIVDNPNWFSFLKKLNEWKINYDIIGLDYYPNYLDDYTENPGDPSKAFLIYDHINKAKYFNKTVIVTETGYSTYNEKHNEINQALFIEKIVLASILSSIKLVVYYRYDDFYYNTTDIEANFGLINYFNKPKLAWNKIKEIKEQKYNLKINFKGDQYFKENKITLENIKINLPINITIFKTKIRIILDETLYYKNILYKLNKVVINEKVYNKNEIDLEINENISITIYYQFYYPLYLFVKTINNYTLKANVKINNTNFEISYEPIYLEGYKHYVIIPQEKIEMNNRSFISATKNLTIYLLSPMNLTLYYIPVYKLKVIINDWLGNEIKANIEIIGQRSYKDYASNIEYTLPSGNYTLRIKSIFSYEKEVHLNEDKLIILTIENFYLLILLFILPFVPVTYLLLRRRKIETKIGLGKLIFSTISSIFLLIILPYLITITSNYFSPIKNNLYKLEDLIIFALPIIIINLIKVKRSLIIYSEALLIIFYLLYFYFIIGRALYGNFGEYKVNFQGLLFSVNVALYIIAGYILLFLRKVLNILEMIFKIV